MFFLNEKTETDNKKHQYNNKNKNGFKKNKRRHNLMPLILFYLLNMKHLFVEEIF